jgi:hypothetical protein
VPQPEIQEALRSVFGRFGLPQEARLDNGFPWATRGDLPSGLVLWMVGLGLSIDHIPPRRPQANGVVERGHDTEKRWVEAYTCADAAEAQRRFDDLGRRQRESYPYRNGRSRLQCYPELAHSGRAYSLAWEQGHFRLEASLDLLAGCVVPRQVDKIGRVSVYSRDYYVGRSFSKQTVFVRFDPQGLRWMFSDEQNRLLQHHPAPEFCLERIRDLTATNGRGAGA